MAVEREVANAHITQITQAGVDLVKQQLARLDVGCVLLSQGGVLRQTFKKRVQLADRPQHQVVQTQTRQIFKLAAAPVHTSGHEALCRSQHGIGIGLAADAPQQAFGFEPCALARRAFGVAAVLGQEHADVHLVGLAFQIGKKALDAIPLSVPVALLEVGGAVDHPAALRRGEPVPRRVAGDASHFGMAHQIVLAFAPCWRLDGFDRALAQRELFVRNHQPPIDPDHAAKAATGLTRAHGGVE